MSQSFVVSFGDIQVEAAYVAIVVYFILWSSSICIVWTCCKERFGIARLKEVQNLDIENCDASQITADVHIRIKSSHNLHRHHKRATTELKLQTLEPPVSHHSHEASSSASLNFNGNATSPPAQSVEPEWLRQLQHNKTATIHSSPQRKNVRCPSSALRLDDLGHLNLPSTSLTLTESKSELDDSVTLSAAIANNMNEGDSSDKQRRCSMCLQLYVLGSKLSLVWPVIMQLIDMSTDIAVICDWLPDCDWLHPYTPHSPRDNGLPNTFWYIVGSILAQLSYRVVSSFRFTKRLNLFAGVLQLLDINIFFECYASVNSKKGDGTLQLRWIRKMESVLESAPQALIQLIYVQQLSSSNDLSLFVQLSLLGSILSITSSVVRSDEWQIKRDSHAYSMCPPNWRYAVRALFRFAEIITRLCIMALLAELPRGVFLVAIILVIELLFYSVMFREQFLGDDAGNVLEILIVHPNLSLTIADEEFSQLTPSTVGCLCQTVLGWIPIAVASVMCESCCCCRRQSSSSSSSSSSSFWQRVRRYMASHLVSVHFVHRCVESVLEIAIFVVGAQFYMAMESSQLLVGLLSTPGFTRTMLLVSVVGTVLTPLLYCICCRWFITGQNGLEMNVFGFLQHAHCQSDLSQFIRYVYRVKSSVNHQNKLQRTPLMEAVERRNFELCKFLCSLTDIVDLSMTDCKGKQIIHYCAQIDDARFMKCILDAHRKQRALHKQQMNIDAVYGPLRKTALIMCASRGFAANAELLLQYGANVNYQDAEGRTCLHYALFAASTRRSAHYRQLIVELLRYNPDLSLCDNKRQWSAVFQAVGGGWIDLVDLLLPRCSGSGGGAGSVRMDAIDCNGDSLLHVAVRYNQPECVQYLLTSQNAKPLCWNVAHTNHKNETALKLSVLHNDSPQCMEMLLRHAYSDNSGDDDVEQQNAKHTALMNGLIWSVKLNAVHKVKLLVMDFALDPNFTDKDEMTPLRWSAFYGHEHVMQLLIIAGARDDFDCFGQNIVFYAAKNNQLHILKYLQRVQCDFCVVNYQGQSATDKTDDERTVQFIQSVREKQFQD